MTLNGNKMENNDVLLNILEGIRNRIRDFDAYYERWESD